MNTINCNLQNDREEIKAAIAEIVEPIANTMSPRGANVLFRNSKGEPVNTNDGATISLEVNPKGELSRLIVDTIKQSSQQTNKVAGDATSTTILLIGTILNLYIDMEENGNTDHFKFIKALKEVKDLIIKEIKKMKIGGDGAKSNMKDIERVAFVSANNDSELAKTTVDVVKKAGEYGLIAYDDRSSQETIVEFEEGFIIDRAVPSDLFLNKSPVVEYQKMKVFIMDGKIFYQEDLNAIMDALVDYDSDEDDNIMIVAREFSAKIPAALENIQLEQNGINILPIVIGSKDIIADLGAYLDVPVYKESKGKIKDDIKEYIGSTDLVGGNMNLLVINKKSKSKRRKERIELIKSQLEKNPDDQKLKIRLSSMTSGVVTLKIGGDTDIERTEKKLRYEDSIRASQNAMFYGYLPGAGTSMVEAFHRIKEQEGYEQSWILHALAFANYKTILNNSNIKEIPEENKKGEFIGLDAVSGKFVDMRKAGIYDSYRAVEQSLLNAVSTSIGLISAMSNTIIIKDNE